MEEILEYLAGLKADGYLLINEKKRDYQYRIYDKSKEFLQLVAELIERMGYEVYIYARGGGRWYELVVYGKDFVLSIGELWRRLLENPTNAFARGLADAEASVIKGNPNRIKFTNRDVAVARAFARALAKNVVPYRTYVERRASGIDYVVVITGVDNIAVFAERIGFLHPAKRKKLFDFWGIESPPFFNHLS
ncbi:hypothetical protein CGL52_10690 [Pyrobaculum aerophilum]|uniref:Homing endonuclease LAGLIDADG domain-containing protein n=1 Tax=Pyrobaculum aerophilum TaxID=13773 RepID=A0A371R070_9CREN|nr:hypothetical protein CGL52_10690 [Pyrobaculum aerophilum]